MFQRIISAKNFAVVLVLILCLNLATGQQSLVSSTKVPDLPVSTSSVGSEPGLASNAAIILLRFSAAEIKVREALNQHTFKRDVVLQTIGPDGAVTGEYIRNSQFLFDDRGRRIERVVFHPASTIHEMKITKEDIQDLADAQLLGIDIVEASKYRLTYAGPETIDSRELLAIDVMPLVAPNSNRMKERFFLGRVWADPSTLQIVKIRGKVEPQGKQRFPTFETWREPIKNALPFPSRTEADDILHFHQRDIHYRIKVRYYDYQLFASKVSIKELDEAPPKMGEPSPKATEPPSETTKPPSKIGEAPPSQNPLPVIRTPNKVEMCTTNRSAPPVGPYHWPADAKVKVYLTRNMFTPAQQLALFEAMTTWTQQSADIGSGVTFNYAGETERRMDCTSCLTVSRKQVYSLDKHSFAFFHPMKQDEGRLLVSAWIDLDFGITDPKALQGFMAHEMGHGMGLWDCPTCKKKRSIMNSFPGINKNNGLVVPSTCDLATLKDVYAQERQVAALKSGSDPNQQPIQLNTSLVLPTLDFTAENFFMDTLRREQVTRSSPWWTIF